MEKTIPSAILTKGISKEGLTNLLNDIEYAVIDEGVDVITEEADKIIDVIREKKPGEASEEWIKKFQAQVAVIDKLVEENIGKIEMLFERIFKDWEEYEKIHITVINLEDGEVKESSEEITEEVVETKETESEEKEEVKNEVEPTNETEEEKPDVEENVEEEKTEGEKDE